MNTDKPLISIITVVFNDSIGLEETIQSVINQIYSNIEYIIIDGGSTDGTLDIIKKYKDKIDYWVSEEDKGIYDAMNKGINIANGGWINFMNAGDIFLPNALKNIEKVLNQNVADVFFFEAIDNNNKLVGKYKFNIMYDSMGVHQSCFIRSQIHRQMLFNLRYKIKADRDLLLRIFLKGFKLNIVRIPICRYDTSGLSSIKIIEKEIENITINFVHKIYTPLILKSVVKILIYYIVVRLLKINWNSFKSYLK